MKKEFVPYQEALELKELGFDRTCLAEYCDRVFYLTTGRNNLSNKTFISAPLYQQAFRWFREKYGYYYPIHRTTNNTNQILYSIGPYVGDYFTYEEAELACLRKLIEIVKEVK